MTVSASTLLDPAYLSTISNYALMARVAVEGYLSGLHRSLYHGFGSEFLQYRAYTPGEDPRYIDWKAYARRDRLQTKVYQEETNMNLYLLVDASASMGYGGSRAPCTKLRYAAMLAAAMAYLAARQGDNVGLTIYKDALVESISPGHRASRMASVYHALERTQPGASAAHQRALDYLEHQLKGRGLVVFLSDMLDAENLLPDLLARIRIRHYDTIAIQVLDPDELDFPTAEAARFVDMESGADVVTSPATIAADYNASTQLAIGQLQRGFQRARIDFVTFSTQTGIGNALSRYLHHRTQRG